MDKINNILLVEDDSITNYINDRLLKTMNVAREISIAVNGQEALNHIKGNLSKDLPLPDLILLDLNMPVMDGFEFLQNYQKLPQEKIEKSLIVVLTTSTHNNDMKKLEEAGNVDYINKPLTKEKIKSVLDKHFSSARVQI